jgi:circadian clock protein KaiC
VPTGVAGLDTMLHGGLLPGSTHLVMGGPGSGKTTLANQLCFHHVRAGGRAVYVTLLAESHSRLFTHVQSYTFYDPAAVGTTLQYFSGYAPLQQAGLPGFTTWLRQVTKQQQATVLVLDGFDTVKATANSELALKHFLDELNTLAELATCTTLLVSQPSAQETTPELTMVDGIITLTDAPVDVRRVRELEVTKLRGSAYLRGRHLFEITNTGLTVYPRTEAVLLPLPDVPQTPPERLTVGIARLDTMLNGGVGATSTTLLVGSPGSGKTLLGLHFLAEGARLDQPSLYFGMFERPTSLIAKAQRAGIPLTEALAAGTLEIVWQSPREAILDVYAERLLAVVRQRHIERVFIDGVDGFRLAAYAERLPAFLLALTDELCALGVTTLLSSELRQLVSPALELPLTGLSALVDNVVLLRYVELRSQLYRLISILKVRDSAYDPAIRAFTIGHDGITVADTFASAEAILTGVARPMHTPPPATRQHRRRRNTGNPYEPDDFGGGG